MLIDRFLFLAFIVLVTVPICAAAPLHERIDQWIEARAGGEMAAPEDDAEFLRRVYLDLNGIVPTADEARAFLADKDSQKRAELLVRLLAGPEYARRSEALGEFAWALLSSAEFRLNH